jgi:Tfp pilus assembly protein PilF/glutathione synthase/RimK-type ligase-like ATP-grasp enzyme
MTQDLSNIQAAQVHEGLAEDFLDDESYKEALAEADAALALNPDSVSASIVRALACKAMGLFWEAADALEAVLARMPALVDLRVNLANIYAELERFTKAEAHLRTAIEFSPSLVEAHASLGSVYIRMVRYDLAEAPTRNALSLDAFNVVANQNLAAILAQKKSPDAHVYRDAAYSKVQVFVERAYAVGAPVALVLSSPGEGNVPHQHLLPRAHYDRVLWYLEFAPQGQDEDPPEHDFVFNAIGDLDAAPNAHKAAERFAARCKSPLINRPECVARTYRSSMASIMGKIENVVAPPAKRFLRTDGDLAAAISESGLRFPLIVRPAGRHGGFGAKRVDSAAKLFESGVNEEAVYATEFVDYRSADGWYRKYRVIFVDRRPYPYHLAIGDHWLLHYWTAGMETDKERRDEEMRFLHDPEKAIGAKAWAALWAIGAEMDLDYAGIDFSILADGRLLFFEANATMLVHPEDEAAFAHKNGAIREILEAVGAMIKGKISPAHGASTKASGNA